MNANNHTLGSDMRKVDAHEVLPHEYDEIPELTETELKRGVWKIAGKEVTSTQGKVAFRAALKNKHRP